MPFNKGFHQVSRNGGGELGGCSPLIVLIINLQRLNTIVRSKTLISCRDGRTNKYWGRGEVQAAKVLKFIEWFEKR